MLENLKDVMVERVNEFDAQPIGDLVADFINNSVMIYSGALYILLEIAVTGIITILLTIITLSIAMRTPLRPYLVDLFGFDTARSYSKYRKMKRAKRLKRK